MAAESLFDESIAEDNEEKLQKSLQLIMREWVYFFFFEKEGVNTPASTSKVAHVIVTGKDNPINVPLIQNSDGTCGVIYFTGEFAVKSAEFNCRVAKMKGRKALELFYGMPVIDAVCLQSEKNYLRISKPQIGRLLGNYT